MKSGRLKTQVQTKPSNVTDSDFCIGFLNVCGLKRRIQYPEFLTFIKNHKILCFAETKLDSHDIISIDGYTYFNQPRRQSYIRKSGGLSFLVHDSIAKYVKRINTESDYIACLSLSRQYHHYEQDIILASVYIPPQQSRFFNQDEFELFERDIMSLRSQHDLFLMLGDFNAQTGTLDDFISADNFLSDHFHFDDETVRFYDQKCELERLGIKTKRSSMDKKKNNTGYQLIDVCKNLNLCILNGRFGKDKNTGALTFRKASVIDYAIITTKCFNLLHDFEIIDLDRVFSDGHRLLHLELKMTNCKTETPRNCNTSKKPCLKQTEYKIYVENFDYEKMDALLQNMQEHEQASTTEINDFISHITQTFHEAALRTKSNFPQHNPATDSNNKPWFGHHCKTARRNYYLAKRVHRYYRSNENREKLISASKLYKRTMNKYINKYVKSKQRRLRNMASKDPKSYWKYLNSLKRNKNDNETPNANEFF